MFVRNGCLAALGLLVFCSVAAQSPQVSVGTAAADSKPQTTDVPVLQAPVRLVDRSTAYEGSEQGLTRAQRREQKALRYAQHIDSLVESRNYTFMPNSMQEYPKGMLRLVVANYFYFGFFSDRVEVHLPTEKWVTQYVYAVNFDSSELSNYKAVQQPWGWDVSFDFIEGGETWQAFLRVSTTTGETILTLISPQVSMRYVGWLRNDWKRE